MYRGIPILLVFALLCINRVYAFLPDFYSKKDTAYSYSLFRKAQNHENGASYDSALYFYQSAAREFKKQKFTGEYLKCRNNIITVKRRSGHTEGIFEEAFANLTLSRKKFGETHTISADCYSILGNLFSDEGNQDSSLFYFRKTLVILTTLPKHDNKKIAYVLRNLGIVHNYKGLFDSASYYINKSTDLLSGLFSPDHPELAGNYNLSGTIAYHLGRFDECEKYFSKILEIRKIHSGINHPLTAEAYNNLAVLYMAKGMYDTALTLNQRALLIRTTTLPENHPNIALSYNNIGNTYMAKGNYEEALAYHMRALEIRHKIFKTENASMAMSYANLGSLFHEIGRFDEALNYFLKALDITEKVFGPDNPHTSEAYNNVGAAFSDLGDYDRSLDYFKKSLTLRMKRGEFSPGVSTSYNNIGSIYKYRGDYDLALSYYRRSVEVIIKLYGNKHPDLIRKYKNMGEVFETEGLIDTALYYYNEALKLNLEAVGEEHSGLASIYLNRGTALGKLNDLQKAKDDYRMGLKITKQSLGDQSSSAANFYSALSSVLLTENKKDSAILLQRKSIRIKEELYPEYHPVLASSYRETGEIYYKLGFPDSARYYYYRSLRSNYPDSFNPEYFNLSVILDENEFALTIMDLCRLNYREYEITDDEYFLEEIIKYFDYLKAVVNIIISDYALEETKIKLLNQLAKQTPFAVEAATTLFRKTGDQAYYYKALEFSELNKSSILQNLIYRYKSPAESGIPERLLRKKRDLLGYIGYLQMKLQKPVYDTVYTPPKNVRNRIDSLMLILRGVNDSINLPALNPVSSNLMTGRELFEKIRARLTSHDALISYYLTDSSLFTFVITTDTSLLIRHNISNNTLQTITDKYLSSLRKYEKENIPALSSQLYRHLFGDFEDVIESKEKLIIIPDKYLFSVPLETLCRTMTTASEFRDFSTYDYLIKRHEFIYHYSTGLWCLDKSAEKQNDGSFIAFAPVFSVHDKPDISLLPPSFRESFSELPFSFAEVDTLKKMFESRGFKTRIFTFNDATEENFKRYIDKFSYIHIATHGIMDNNNPEYSGLVFMFKPAAPEDSLSENGNDGVVYARDLYPLEINANLVVLSACETVTGRIEEGEGIIGLIRGFLSAGAGNVMFSFWKVGDRNTLRFMNSFYKNILSGISYSSAIRYSKIDLINNPETSFPLLWGGFAIIGH